eukprot:SAG31_NODE_21002_length_560_cov_0.501085_1_plen_68_part_10
MTKFSTGTKFSNNPEADNIVFLKKYGCRAACLTGKYTAIIWAFFKNKISFFFFLFFFFFIYFYFHFFF